MKIVQDLTASYKKSPVKFIAIALLVLVGLIFAWYIILPLVVVVFLWKKFKKDEESKKGTKKICPHCKTEIDWEASRCPNCHGKMYVWTSGSKILTIIFIIVLFVGIVKISSFTSSSTSTTTPKEPSDIEICLEAEHLLEQFLKAPSTAKFPSCSSVSIIRVPGERFKVSSYVDSQNSFGAMIRSNWSIYYHYTDNGTKIQLDDVIIDGKTMLDGN